MVYVRIRLNYSKENNDKGFYILLTNGSTYSNKVDEFVIDEKLLSKLEDNHILYDRLPLD